MRSNAAKYESTSASVKVGTREIHLLTSNAVPDMEVEPGESAEADEACGWDSSSSLRSLNACLPLQPSDFKLQLSLSGLCLLFGLQMEACQPYL